MNVLYVRRTFAYFLNERIDKIDIKEQNASSARLHKYHKGLLSAVVGGESESRNTNFGYIQL